MSLREQFAFPLHDERSIMKQFWETFMGAVMMGHNEPTAAHKGNGPIKHDVVNIKLLQKLGPHRGHHLVERITKVSGLKACPPAQYPGLNVAQIRKRQHGC